MKTLIYILAVITSCYGSEDSLRKKRGIFGESLYGGIHPFSSHFAYHPSIPISYHIPSFDYHQNLEYILPYQHNIFDIGWLNDHFKFSNEISVPIPHSYTIGKIKKIEVPIPQQVPAVTLVKPSTISVNEPSKNDQIQKTSALSSHHSIQIGPGRIAPLALGSGSLGYAHLGNGVYALGSGSIGVSGRTSATG